MLRNFLLLILLFSLASQRSFSQSSEMGIFLGATTYKGELSSSLFNTRFIKPAVGILYRHSFNNHWSYRIGLNYGTVTGDDSESNIGFNVRRNLSFRSRIWDLNGMFEFNFFPYQTANQSSTFSPFIMAGLSIYKFNPQAELGDEWHDLQPLGTEGQGSPAYPEREKYKRVKVAIPFGGGVKFKLSRRFGMSVEAGARRIFTDYLDDVSTTYPDKAALLAANGALAVALSDRSLVVIPPPDHSDRQRGNASDNDWFMFSGVTLTYTLSGKYNDNCSPFKRKLR